MTHFATHHPHGPASGARAAGCARRRSRTGGAAAAATV